MITKSKYEKLFTALVVTFLIATLIVKSLCGASIQSSNARIERLRKEIDSQNKTNASLQMKINELASLDNTLDVADAYGLSYNNSNIRIIGE